MKRERKLERKRLKRGKEGRKETGREREKIGRKKNKQR